MFPVRLWMKAAFALAAALNLVLGIALLGFYHEVCKVLQVPKPASVLLLQVVGGAAVASGIVYWLAIRWSARFRRLVLLIFLLQASMACAIADGLSAHQLPPICLIFLFEIAVINLLPLTHILPRLFSLADLSKPRFSDPNSRQTASGGSSNSASRGLFRLATIAMLVAVVLPPSWAVAHLVSDAQAKQAALARPAKWQVLEANLPTEASDEFHYAAVDAWPNMRFVDPTFIGEIPDGSGRMVVLERPGRIVVFSKQQSSSPTAKQKPQTLLDIADRTMQVTQKAEDGLLGLAFHPHYADTNAPQRGWIFVRYTANTNGKRSNRLSRFVVPPGAAQADAKSETILIDLPEKTVVHKGGALAFGFDGFLYTTFGTDGEFFPNEHAQRIDHGLWAGVLRIDVDCQGGRVSHPSPRQPDIGKTAGYYIPNDNPFVGAVGAMEEFFSIGFRNPWRMTIDRRTGTIWVGDVGDRRREEIDICTSGSNHQWNYLEGTLPTKTYAPNAPSRPEHVLGVETPPVYEYQHDGLNHCVIGGYVYRGSKFPELAGKYIYADQGGRIYALTVDADNHLVSNELISAIRDPGLGVSSLGEDTDGELYFCTIHDLTARDSQIYRLEPKETTPAQQWPETLSATGLFTDLKTLGPNSSLMSYEVNVSLWSDRAQKQRWIGLVSHEKIDGEVGERWKFPSGTVFVKHFDLPLDERSDVEGSSQKIDGGSDSQLRRVETRVLICNDHSDVFGASYRWNDDQTDAVLVDSRQTEEIEYINKQGESQKQTWLYPGRFDCLACHNTLSGGVLGFNARQLNREISSGGISENQLAKFAAAGMFAFDCSQKVIDQSSKLVPLSDSSASVEQRVRSYLDANCSHCHQAGSRFGLWDGRIEVPLQRQGIVDGTAVSHRGANPNARVVSPGNLDLSFLYVRMNSQESHLRMPPLGRNVVHQEAVELLKQWIESMPKKTGNSNSTLDVAGGGQDR